MLKLWGPAPSYSHNSVSWNDGIYAILWKCMTMFPLLYYISILYHIYFTSGCVGIAKIAQFWHKKLTSKKSTVLWSPLYYGQDFIIWVFDWPISKKSGFLTANAQDVAMLRKWDPIWMDWCAKSVPAPRKKVQHKTAL